MISNAHRLAAALVAATALVGGPALAAPTVDDARAFLDRANTRLYELQTIAGRAAWIQANFITFDSNALAARTREEWTAALVEAGQGASAFDGIDLPEDLRRQLDFLKLSITQPAPADAAKNRELAEIASDLKSRYGSGHPCTADGECRSLEDLEAVIDGSRDAEALTDAWVSWRTISPPMRDEYARFVEIANEGAQELGYDDVGTLWRSGYDMDPRAFRAELDRIWEQVRPLYEALHCHVRAALNETYGDEVVPLDQPIPAHLLGNMWAQEWGNIFDLVAPADADPGYDLTELLEAHDIDEMEMVRIGERFFTSLGFEPLPDTFWERSLFVKPADREVVCHASAWDLDDRDDLRIKMCIEVNAEDFQTIHHELGHNFYQRAYKEQPLLYRDSANDGFHEAIGDTIALSVTPSYLVQIGLLDAEPDASKDIGLLLRQAMDKIAFLPFGLLIDQWRWQVFSGEVGPEGYNEAWWSLREKYQGLRPPVERSESDFDPGAKYHVPANVPYTRYFLARILQFQFHRALCDLAGYEGPVHRCSIYGNEAAGEALASMLEMGKSSPWPEALEVVTGSQQMDATAILDYFAPLSDWLAKQNEGRTCGW